MEKFKIEYKLDEHSKKIKEHDAILKEHDGKLTELDKGTHSLAASIDRLTNQISIGFSIGKWFVGLMLGQFVIFFFAMILKLF